MVLCQSSCSALLATAPLPYMPEFEHTDLLDGPTQPVPTGESIPFTVSSGVRIDLAVFWDPNTKKENIYCDLCGTSISLSSHRSLNPFQTHRLSRRCKKASVRVQPTHTLVGEVSTLGSIGNTTSGPSLPATGLQRRFSHIRSISTSSASSSLTVTSAAEGYSTPTAVTSNLSALPPSSPPIWDTSSSSDSEEDKGSDGDKSVLGPSLLLPSLSIEVEACPGSLIQWQPGSVWNSYPYHQHAAQSLPWEPIGFEPMNQLRLRSTKCKLILETSKELDEHACSRCRAIETSAAFVKFLSHANAPAKHTPWTYLSQRHLYELLTKLSAENRLLKLKVCNQKNHREIVLM